MKLSKKEIYKGLRFLAEQMPVPRRNNPRQVITWKANYRRLKSMYKQGLINLKDHLNYEANT